MKIFVVALIALFAIQSQARSLAPNTLLQLSVTPFHDLHHLPVGVKNATLITIDQFGSALGRKCTEKINVQLGVGRPFYYDCHSFVELKNLSGQEVRRINVLIESARHGEIQSPDPRQPHCLAIPFQSKRFTADNGNVFLAAGSYPCGGETVNTSPATKELKGILNNALQEYNSRVNETR